MFQGLIKKAYQDSFRKGFYTLELLIFLTGYNFSAIQEFFNMRNGTDGVAYYGEVHLSFWNSLIHSFFMPITMCGMYVWIPTVINATPYQAREMKRLFMTFYVGHYARISLLVTALIVAMYAIPYACSGAIYHNLYTWGTVFPPQRQVSALAVSPRRGVKSCFYYGFLMALGALVIQEVFGHWYGGDAPSRPEAVPNAIAYAIYYSVSHLVDHVSSL